MESHHIVGTVFLVAAAMDAGVALPILRSRIADERTKGIVTIVIAVAALAMAVLGALFLTGTIGR